MYIVNVIENLDERYGGPAKSVTLACKYINKLNINTCIRSIQLYSEERNDIVIDNNLDWLKFPSYGPKIIRFSPQLYKHLEKECAVNEVVIHSQNLWNFPAYAVLNLKGRYGVPLVTSIRGALYDWSLNQSKIKKNVAWYSFQRRALEAADCLHVTEPGELEAVRQLGISSPVALIPNGVELDVSKVRLTKSESSRKLGLNPETRYVLFLSRLHKKKGVDLLIKAWGYISAKFPNWHLLIAGHCEDEVYMDYLVEEVNLQGVDDSITFLGMLHGKERDAALELADLFVLPSHTENFGIAIAEALASSCPVITTTGTPWKEIVDYKAGWWVELSLGNLIRSLEEAMTLPVSELHIMGENGLRLIQKYRWEKQAEKFQQLYRWVLKKENKPDFIDIK